MKQRLAALLRSQRSTHNAPRVLTVREAWLAHERYVGQSVLLRGVVRIFDAASPDEYFTLDDGPNRVGLRGDAARLRTLVDCQVTATGQLVFKPGVGIFLEADQVQPVA